MSIDHSPGEALDLRCIRSSSPWIFCSSSAYQNPTCPFGPIVDNSLPKSILPLRSHHISLPKSNLPLRPHAPSAILPIQLAPSATRSLLYSLCISLSSLSIFQQNATIIEWFNIHKVCRTGILSKTNAATQQTAN